MTLLDLVAQMVWLPRRLLLMLGLWEGWLLVRILHAFCGPAEYVIILNTLEVIARSIYKNCRNFLFVSLIPILAWYLSQRGRSSHASHRKRDTTISCVERRVKLSRQHRLLSTDPFPSPTLIYEFLSSEHLCSALTVPRLIYNYCVHHKPFLAE